MTDSLNRLKRTISSEGATKVRRHASHRADAAAAVARKRWGPRLASAPLDDEARIALVTVNFSTTRYLKLLLLTVLEQQNLSLLQRILVIDNDSRDGGATFLDRLSNRVPRVHVIHRRHRLFHGPGMRAGVRALDAIERTREVPPANLLLFCDTDVILLAPDVLEVLAEQAVSEGAALIGEVRLDVNARPDIQASFFAVRRDVYAQRRVPPLVHSGSPAYRLQRAVWDAGLPVANIPSNHGGLILHRGRTGVAAASRYGRRHPYAGAARSEPHFMGVVDGETAWNTVEQRYSELLHVNAEDRLIELLGSGLEAMGGPI